MFLGGKRFETRKTGKCNWLLVVMKKSYMQHELLKHLDKFAEGKIWCVGIISDQYIEFSGSMVPNYAPV